MSRWLNRFKLPEATNLYLDAPSCQLHICLREEIHSDPGEVREEIHSDPGEVMHDSSDEVNSSLNAQAGFDAAKFFHGYYYSMNAGSLLRHFVAFALIFCSYESYL